MALLEAAIFVLVDYIFQALGGGSDLVGQVDDARVHLADRLLADGRLLFDGLAAEVHVVAKRFAVAHLRKEVAHLAMEGNRLLKQLLF